MYAAPEEYRSEDLDHGLFRSTLLLKAFKLIFTSPSSAHEVEEMKGPIQLLDNTRHPGTALLAMKSVTPCAITYVAVRVLATQGTNPESTSYSCGGITEYLGSTEKLQYWEKFGRISQSLDQELAG
ncbi:hypothetical protein SERLA73DRAFT_154906 [Serpula lacrymans var. lacrymans S7.3]|uniref:Uncharacterized protein n=1 Tax=Serpula lacrymans var. lacrymans (strain S7.3) TaxID=936435 RepID=F8Q7H6_SERL3|nr:hypothetical protein SERLA73DRAFT_154906 [Serpula lacrymans var. lacrymans S7.3]